MSIWSSSSSFHKRFAFFTDLAKLNFIAQAWEIFSDNSRLSSMYFYVTKLSLILKSWDRNRAPTKPIKYLHRCRPEAKPTKYILSLWTVYKWRHRRGSTIFWQLITTKCEGIWDESDNIKTYLWRDSWTTLVYVDSRDVCHFLSDYTKSM